MAWLCEVGATDTMIDNILPHAANVAILPNHIPDGSADVRRDGHSSAASRCFDGMPNTERSFVT